MKTLILDYSKWRSGAEGDNKVGEGKTKLLNSEGFMCCLGQFSTQLAPELSKNSILGESSPAYLSKSIPGLSYKKIDIIKDTPLSNKAIEINDNEDTTPERKIVLLRKLFRSKGYKIKVINKCKPSKKK